MDCTIKYMYVNKRTEHACIYTVLRHLVPVLVLGRQEGHWVLHLPATREVAGSSPAVAHLTAKSPRRSSPDQGVGPLHSVESSRASCNSRCRKAGSRPDMATSPCLAPKTKMIVADWPKLKKKKKREGH